jgi:hypothetical protein
VAEQAIRLDSVSAFDLVKRLDTEGVVCLEDVISATWLDAVRAAVPAYITVNGDQDFLVADIGNEETSPTYDLVNDPALGLLFSSVAEAGWAGTQNSQQIQSGLTVRSGLSKKAPSMLFHYDASVLTMVIPIIIPEEAFGTCAELVALPNKRPFRRFLVSHIVDKLLTHNFWYRRRIARQAISNPEKNVVDLQPGNAYLFWGYRALHGNLPCAPGLLRVTLILQCGEVHRQSLALSLARSFRQWRLRRMQVTSAPVLDSPTETPRERADEAIKDFELAC